MGQHHKQLSKPAGIPVPSWRSFHPQPGATHPPAGFWIVQLLVLLASATGLYVVFDHFPLDPWFTHWYFDAATRSFPLRDAWLTDTLAHDWVKKILFVIAAILMAGSLAGRWWPRYRKWPVPAGFVLLGMILAPGVVGILKSASHHSCPWDLAVYTGSNGSGGTEYRLFAALPSNPGRGKCFPGGHAAGGFSVMVFYFIAYAAGKRKAWLYALAGFILGFGMGYTQLMRGAHFLSHNLWSGWVVWAVLTVLFYLYTVVAKVPLAKLAAPASMLSDFRLGHRHKITRQRPEKS